MKVMVSKTCFATHEKYFIQKVLLLMKTYDLLNVFATYQKCDL